MRLSLVPTAVALLTALAAGVDAQDEARRVRLVEDLAQPLVWCSFESGGQSALRLLEDQSLRMLTGADAGSSSEVATALTQLLSFSTGEVEIALTGILPRRDLPALPLMVGRVQLSEQGRDALTKSLAEGKLVERYRRVAGIQTYRWAGSKRRPGATIEVAVLGDDLLVGNTLTALDALLARASGGTSDREPDSLSRSETFLSLGERLASRPTAVRLFVDWSRARRLLMRHVSDSLALHAIGFGSATSMLCGIEVHEDRIDTVALLDQPQGVDGLLAAVEPVPVRQLVQDLPGVGFGCVSFAIDPTRFGANMVRGPAVSFRASLMGRCNNVGLDLENQVLPRLGRSASCRIVLLGDTPGTAFALQTKSTRHSEMIVRDLQRALERLDVPFQERGEKRESTMVVESQAGSLALTAMRDSLVFSSSTAVLDRMRSLEQSAGRKRTSRRAEAAKRLQRIVSQRGAKARRAVGVFDLDPSSLVPANAGQDTEPAGHHSGLFFLDDGVVRVEIVSSF